MKKIFGVFLVMVALALFASACGGKGAPSEGWQKASPTPAVQTEKVFRLNAPNSTTWDPQQCNDTTCAMYIVETYSGLATIVLVPEAELDTMIESGRDIRVLMPEVAEKMPQLWQDWADSYLKEADGMVAVLAPDIAKEIPEPEYKADGTVSYTFHLRENVRFHNGKPVTAKDFAFSLKRAASPDWPDPRSSVFTLPTADLYLSDIIGVRDVMDGKADEIAGVEVLDDYTLRITIDASKPYFLWKLSYPTAFVIDKDRIIDPVSGELVPGNWTSSPNGTGPFIAYPAGPGGSITKLVANDDFYLGRPFLDKIVFNHEAGQNTIFDYDDGNVDITGVGIDYLPRVRQGSGQYNAEFASQYMATPEFSTYYIGFNTEKPPFDDPKVRQAFVMATNVADLEVIGEGLFITAQGVLPPGIPGYDENFQGLPYDPERARALLRESRYRGTDALKNIEYLRGGQGPSTGDVISQVLDQWKKNLGITVLPNEPSVGGVYQNYIRRGNFQIFSGGWVADYPDAEDFLDLMFYCGRTLKTGFETCVRDFANNRTRYYNPEVDKLLEAARVEQNVAKRLALYREAHEIIVQDAPWIPLVHTRNSVAVKPWVKGYYPAPMVIPIFRFIDIKQ